mmetsp:Transcript_15401/g.19840  ORF Transcript_15401/g.19840 Transcript_15401/m.19840 type:complete len:84 (+) Transcript_15401:586-837(+)
MVSRNMAKNSDPLEKKSPETFEPRPMTELLMTFLMVNTRDRSSYGRDAHISSIVSCASPSSSLLDGRFRSSSSSPLPIVAAVP